MTQPTKQQILTAIYGLQARLAFVAVCAENLGSISQGNSSAIRSIYVKFNDMMNSCSNNDIFLPLQSFSSDFQLYGAYLSGFDNYLKTYISKMADTGIHTSYWHGPGLEEWVGIAFADVQRFHDYLTGLIQTLNTALQFAPDS